MADRKAAAGGAPVFRYSFERPSPLLEGALARPTPWKMPSVFNQMGSPLIGGDATAAPTASRMGDAWVNFAATGAPGGDWRPYGSEKAVMRIGEARRLESNPFGAEEALFAPTYR